MSDFPDPLKFKDNLSRRFTEKLNSFNIRSPYPVIINKEKGAYLYDIDGNKYADFHLNHGSAIAGHNHKTLTRFIKNGISAGTESGMMNKFHTRLIATISEYFRFKSVSFYNCISSAVAGLLSGLPAGTIGCTSNYLSDILKTAGAANSGIAIRDNDYGVLFYEPLDFDNNLEPVDPMGYRAKVRIAVENRTAFRDGVGLMVKPENTDFSICGNILANGMDCAAVMSASRETPMGELIPVYKTIAINETLKFYKRHGLGAKEWNRIPARHIAAQKGSIFILKPPVDTAELMKHGVFLSGRIGFLSTEHTYHDIRRLSHALDSLSGTE
ncbi:MAG: hypothetical protein A2Y33_09155 [Spirochaetes bacterium GWF1_51_8]|nr:MAG: hypothetical protein A2Y33_09155 [Spirochaetes bacterium GWF1_51_8]